MPLAFILALAASLGIHAAALFGTDVEVFGGANDEPVPLLAELQPPPPAPPAPPPKAAAPTPHVKTPKPAPAKHAPEPVAVPAPAANQAPEAPAPIAEAKSPEPAVEPLPPPPPVQAKPLLPAQGSIRFAIFRGTRGFQIGRAEHRWEFTADGHYRLTGTTETSGLAALFVPLVFEAESSGRLIASGLQPEQYRTHKNGKAGNDNADFDWSAGEVHLAKNGSVQPVAHGAQDMLSLNYQLAYLNHPENGAVVGVVTGKKVDRFTLEALGEEQLDIASGHFRTLHLRATGDTVTEIWIALDRNRLPVKIRYTDKKGDVYEQVATEIGSP